MSEKASKQAKTGITNTLRSAMTVFLALTAAEAAELPPLSKAREVGRYRSSFLTDDKRQSAVYASHKADLTVFKSELASAFLDACVGCHGPEKAKGRFRFDQLNPDLINGPDINRWLEVFEAISNSEMPPEDQDKFHLADADRAKAIDWLGREIKKASIARKNEGGHSSFRRMTRYEFNYALQDLLKLPHHQFGALLPPETPSEDGFKNSSAMLQMSAMQFSNYRSIALHALRKAAVNRDRPKSVHYQLSTPAIWQAQGGKRANGGKGAKGGGLLNLKTGERRKLSVLSPKMTTTLRLPQVKGAVVAVLERSANLKLNLQHHLPDEGLMRVRIRAALSDTKPESRAALRLILSAHTSNNANFANIVSRRDLSVRAEADEAEYIDFFIPLSEVQRNPFRKNKKKFPRRDEFLSIQHISHGSSRADVHIDYIEITAPFYESWPPASRRSIFIESPNSEDEIRYSREVLYRFMSRAWRRTIAPYEVGAFMSLFDSYRKQLPTFEAAMIETLAAVLSAPDFLYLAERVRTPKAGQMKLTDHELATRLSFFLWSSLPDETLLKLAGEGRLSDPKILSEQISRMRSDPRFDRFGEHFVSQWLGLDALDSVAIDRKVHRQYSESLKAFIRKEPLAYFNEVLSGNQSVMDFLHSDYAVINEPLSRLYRIPGVQGPEFRHVALDSKYHRGGLLTMSAILMMNSDGKDSHPLKRGIWLLEHLLHDPPPAPPPNVPEVDLTDPRILKMTLKERIEDHRNHAACRSCHAKIDPWGIAFENYDALGSYRTKIGKAPVDATAALYNRQELAGMDGLKRYLLTDRQDQFARAMVHKMSSYALGRPLSFSDHADIDLITKRFRKGGDRLGDLLTLIVTSDLFRSKRIADK